MNKQQWIRGQACAICGAPPRSECSHVTTAANHGIGIKPSDEFVIPCCNRCHRLEHTHGRAEVLKRILGLLFDRYAAKDWYLEKAAYYERMYKKTPSKGG